MTANPSPQLSAEKLLDSDKDMIKERLVQQPVQQPVVHDISTPRERILEETVQLPLIQTVEEVVQPQVPDPKHESASSSCEIPRFVDKIETQEVIGQIPVEQVVDAMVEETSHSTKTKEKKRKRAAAPCEPNPMLSKVRRELSAIGVNWSISDSIDALNEKLMMHGRRLSCSI